MLRLFLSLVNCLGLAHHTQNTSMLRLLATRAWRTPVAAASIAAIGAGGAAACMRLEEDVKVRGTLASPISVGLVSSAKNLCTHAKHLPPSLVKHAARLQGCALEAKALDTQVAFRG